MPDLWKRLDALAAVLGVARDVIWSALIRQQILDGITMIGLGIVAAGISMWGLRELMNARAKERNPDKRVGYIVGAVCLTVTTILLAWLVLVGAWRLLNPEYFAVQALLEMLR